MIGHERTELRDCIMVKKTYEIDTAAGRARALRHHKWQDHDVLRAKWHNFELVADGVYRSNHPSYERFAKYKEMGIKTVLNLRGDMPKPFYLFEKEACDDLGLTLVTVRMSARKVPRRTVLLDVMQAMDTMEKPFLIHCKSGADRTGLVSAFYLLQYTDASDDVIRKHLSFRYLHIRKSSTGALDFALETYLARRAQSPISLWDWLDTEYDEVVLTAAYKAQKAKEAFWQGW